MGVRRPRIVLTGGGTGGHVYPALALASALRGEAELLYVGTAGGLEASLVPKAGIPFREIHAGGVVGKAAFGKAGGIIAAGRGFYQSLALLHRFRPDAVVGTGGYVSGPVLLAAAILRLPILIQEQNLRPGLTNRLLSPLARVVVVPYDESLRHLPRRARGRAVIIGNPVRPEVLAWTTGEAKAELGLAGRKVVLLFGGSGGALRLNEAALKLTAALGPDETLLWATGPRYYENFARRLAESGNSGDRVRILPYIEQMEIYLAAADLIVSRAGAMAMAEIFAVGKPSVLVPSPNVAHDHQRGNARLAAWRGAALLLEEEDLPNLPKLVRELLDNSGRREELAAAARRLGQGNALEQLVAEVRKVATRRRSS